MGTRILATRGMVLFFLRWRAGVFFCVVLAAAVNWAASYPVAYNARPARSGGTVREIALENDSATREIAAR